jgi:RNA polymerase-binding protein DksA
VSTLDTAEFRTELERERERLVGAIARLHEAVPRNMEDEVGELAGRVPDNHLGDMATVTFDRELDESLEEGVQQRLAQIEHALTKIEDGTYGICEQCGREIGEERLRARPWALLCIDDQRLVDRG